MSEENLEQVSEAPVSDAAPQEAATETPAPPEGGRSENQIAQEMAATYDSIHSNRNPNGQFAPKQKPQNQERGQDHPNQPQAPHAPADASHAEAIKAWQAMPAEARWQALPPQARQALEETNALDTLAAQHGLQIPQGMPRHQFFLNLLGAHHSLERDPVNSLRWLANSYGIDLRQLAGQPPGPPPELDRGAVEGLVHRFQSENSELWPLVKDEVYTQIVALKQYRPYDSPETTLKTAFARALKIVPEARAYIETREREATETKSRAEASKRAAAAKRAGSVNVRSGQAVSAKPTGSWRDTMQEVADRLMP